MTHIGKKQPEKLVKFGGMKIKLSQVKEGGLKVQKTENGDEYFVVSFKNGVQAKYPQQTSKGAQLDSVENGDMWSAMGFYKSDTKTTVHGTNDIVLTGTEQGDDVIVTRSTNVDIFPDEGDNDINIINSEGSEVFAGEGQTNVTVTNSSNSEIYSADNVVFNDKNMNRHNNDTQYKSRNNTVHIGPDATVSKTITRKNEDGTVTTKTIETIQNTEGTIEGY